MISKLYSSINEKNLYRYLEFIDRILILTTLPCSKRNHILKLGEMFVHCIVMTLIYRLID